MELGESHRRVGKKIEGPEEDRDFIGKPTESTNLDPWGLPETESPSKQHTKAEPSPHCTYVADVQLDLHLGPPTTDPWPYPAFVVCL